jgi:Co/Zn/Cd efflux system component
MQKSIFIVSKMDCPSEERIIRMKLEDMASIKHMDFNIPERMLTITHEGEAVNILERLTPLNFGASLKETVQADVNISVDIDSTGEAKVLKLLLLINGGMFFFEFILGIFAESMGLISDSFDMLADASVYMISLYAVGKSVETKKKSASVNGYFQIILGTGVLIETLRRFIYGSDPEPSYMIAVSVVALAANIYCLYLLSAHKEGGAHMKASYICSSTDVMANAGVILAGVLVMITKSAIPDLVIGIIVVIIVLRGANAILKVAK